MTKANINNVKIGDKAYIEVEITDVIKQHEYPIRTNYGIFNPNGCVNLSSNEKVQLYIKEEIPTLGEGVEMMVSDDGQNWHEVEVIAKHCNQYCDIHGAWWSHIKPIELTIEEQLANALKEIEELKKQLNEKQASE